MSSLSRHPLAVALVVGSRQLRGPTFSTLSGKATRTSYQIQDGMPAPVRQHGAAGGTSDPGWTAARPDDVAIPAARVAAQSSAAHSSVGGPWARGGMRLSA